jgi:hypothetical protein
MQLLIISIVSVLWSLGAAFFLRRDTASPAPILAMFVPLALSAASMWFAVLQLVRSGALTDRAGRADSMLALIAGAASALTIGVIALIRRHRPVADAPTLILAAMVLATVIIALTYAPAFEIAAAGLVLSIAAAVAALVWLFFVARGVIAGPRIPYAAIAIFAAMLLIGSVTVHCYFELTGVITHAHG